MTAQDTPANEGRVDTGPAVRDGVADERLFGPAQQAGDVLSRADVTAAIALVVLHPTDQRPARVSLMFAGLMRESYESPKSAIMETCSGAS